MIFENNVAGFLC